MLNPWIFVCLLVFLTKPSLPEQLYSYLQRPTAVVKNYLFFWEFLGGIRDISVPKAKVQQDRKSQAYFQPLF